MEPVGVGRKYSTYRIEKLIGSDTFGNLYMAYDEVLDRPVALKVLSAGLSAHEDVVQHFRKNMQNLAQIAHPGIPQIYYFGKQEREHFVASEWCTGGSLSNRLRKEGRLPMPVAVKVLLQCIQALAAAWKLGIAHGNLKPNSVMIDDEGDIKITNFGVALEPPDPENAESISGAISFMAPEMSNRGRIDFRADIYSLGIIFYFMLLNSLPPVGSLDRPPGPDDSRSSLPPFAQQVIERMTREDPEQRYADYDEMTRDVEQLAASLQDVPAPAAALSVPKAIDVESSASRKGESPFDMLADLYRENTSGILKINWYAVQKKLLVRRGEIVLFESSLPAESLANLALTEKWLLPSDVPQDTGDAETLIRRILQSGKCSVDQFAEAYRKAMRKAVLHAFQWPVFQGEFFAGRIENESFASLRLPDILLEASRTLLDIESIRSRIPQDSLISRAQSFEQMLAPFPLNHEESFLAYRFEGGDMTPATLSALTGLPDDTILRVTYLLQKIGALELRSAAAARPPRLQKRPAPPPQPPPPPPRVVQPAVPTPAVDVRPVVPEKPPEKPRPQQPPPLPAVPDQKGKKVTFEEALIRVESPQPVRHMESKSGVKRAEALFEKAQQEYDTGNFGKAAQYCKEALQFHQAAEYYHLLGAAYARHPRFQRDAEEAFHKAIALAPTSPDYHAVLALFYSQRELWLRARTHCQKALDLSAGHKMANTVYQKVLDKKLGKGDCWCVASASRPTIAG